LQIITFTLSLKRNTVAEVTTVCIALDDITRLATCLTVRWTYCKCIKTKFSYFNADDADHSAIY